MKYYYEEIAKITRLSVDELKSIIKEDWLKEQDLRKIVDSMTDTDSQIHGEVKSYNKDRECQIISSEMLRLLVVLRRLNYSETLRNLASFISSNPQANLRYFSAFALQHCHEFPATFNIPGRKDLPGSTYGTIQYTMAENGCISTDVNYYKGQTNDIVKYETIVLGLYQYISQ